MSQINNNKIAVNAKGQPVHATNITVKMSLLAVYNALGGTEGMYKWASSSEENLREFYKMYAKLIPRQTDITSNGEPLQLTVMRYVDAQVIDNHSDEQLLLEDARKLVEMSESIVSESQASTNGRET